MKNLQTRMVLAGEYEETARRLIQFRSKLLDEDQEWPLVKQSFMVSSCFTLHVGASFEAARTLVEIMESTTSPKIRKKCVETLIKIHGAFHNGLEALEKGQVGGE